MPGRGDPFANWPVDDGSMFAFVGNGSWTSPQPIVGNILAINDAGLGLGLEFTGQSNDPTQKLSYWENDGHDFTSSHDLLDVSDFEPSQSLSMRHSAHTSSCQLPQACGTR